MLKSQDPRTWCHDRKRLRPAVLPAPPPSLARRGALRPLPSVPGARGQLAQIPNKLSSHPGLETRDSGFPARFLLEPLSPWTRSEQPPSPRPSLRLQPLWGGALRAPGEFPRAAGASLAFLSRLYLDISAPRSCPQDDHAGRSCAQDDAAGSGAELSAQRVPAGR